MKKYFNFLQHNSNQFENVQIQISSIIIQNFNFLLLWYWAKDKGWYLFSFIGKYADIIFSNKSILINPPPTKALMHPFCVICALYFLRSVNTDVLLSNLTYKKSFHSNLWICFQSLLYALYRALITMMEYSFCSSIWG